MFSDHSLQISRYLLAALGTQMFLYHQDRIPRTSAVLVVSNHRSFLDPILLTATIGRPIRFACHHYMGQVPLIREMVTTFGAFPLSEPRHRQQHFFAQATALLQAGEMVGLFPEGAEPMLKFTPATAMGKFQRGFAHLAMRAPIDPVPCALLTRWVTTRRIERPVGSRGNLPREVLETCTDPDKTP
jgi:1-acyl-sn-glycerol-3-phosphate acyltransferase